MDLFKGTATYCKCRRKRVYDKHTGGCRQGYCETCAYFKEWKKDRIKIAKQRVKRYKNTIRPYEGK
jgi:hypothetical protein